MGRVAGRWQLSIAPRPKRQRRAGGGARRRTGAAAHVRDLLALHLSAVSTCVASVGSVRERGLQESGSPFAGRSTGAAELPMSPSQRPEGAQPERRLSHSERRAHCLGVGQLPRRRDASTAGWSMLDPQLFQCSQQHWLPCKFSCTCDLAPCCIICRLLHLFSLNILTGRSSQSYCIKLFSDM